MQWNLFKVVDKLVDAKERNIVRKQNKAKHSKQRTLFECFQRESGKGVYSELTDTTSDNSEDEC